jgi:hypothetical protein
VQRLRVEYWHNLGEVKLADLVFVDESGVNLAMSRRYARSFEGTRAYGERPDGRGKNVTMIGAISLEGFVASLTFEGGTDSLACANHQSSLGSEPMARSLRRDG